MFGLHNLVEYQKRCVKLGPDDLRHSTLLGGIHLLELFMVKWKRKMVASAFGEDQGCSSAPRPIGLFFLIASMSTLKPLLKEDTPKLNATNYQRNKAKVLTTDLDIGAALRWFMAILVLRHGDFLGSILGTGIVRDRVGIFFCRQHISKKRLTVCSMRSMVTSLPKGYDGPGEIDEEYKKRIMQDLNQDHNIVPALPGTITALLCGPHAKTSFRQSRQAILTRLVENLGGLVKRCNPESRQNKQGLELLSCQGAKDKAYEDLYKKLDSKEVANDIFRIAKARERRRDLGDISYVNDEGGRSITNEEDIKKRLGEYFSSLFNAIGSEDRDEDCLTEDGENKAVGPDQILIEAWRCLGYEGGTWLTCLFNKIFTSAKMPEEWRLSEVIPIYKNTDGAQVYSNYRGIKLLCHTMKLWERVIEKRLRREIRVSKNQFGFMHGRLSEALWRNT
ncbi:hypothetical protein Tco_0875147 [Tanacetum coccineum]|uniref:Reverse transcriptase domain-containing protein n=1 Tax=Tanacetum coccineum TaxID=301880 RepID=A0ABQ5BRP5_9ASTR